MRSQVQVLAGPPPIPAGHSAGGNQPGTPAASLGRAGAASLSPPAPRARGHPDVPPPRPPPTVVTHPAETAATRPVRPPRAPACSPAYSVAASRRRSTRRAGLPGRAAGQRGRRPPHPGPGPSPTPIDQRATATASSRPPGLLGHRPSRPTARPLPSGPRPVAVVTVACRLDLVPTPLPRHCLRWEQTDATGPTGRTPDGWRQWAGRWTGGQQPAGSPNPTGTQVTGHRTAGQQPAGQPDPGRRTAGWPPDGRTPVTDAPAASRQCRPRRQRLTAQQHGRRGGTTLLRTGLATAATVSCRWYAAIQLAPRRTALLGKRLGSRVARDGGCHPLWRVRLSVDVGRFSRGAAGREWGAA
jgi:hypothetical protein